MTGQAGMSVSQRHVLRTLKYLNHRLILIAGNDTAKLFLLSIYYNFNNFIICGILHALNGNQRTVDLT